MAIVKEGQVIRTLDEWRERAGPKRKNQWAEHRSAMEAARCWLAISSPALPGEVARVLASHPAFGIVQAWDAEPEVRMPFDSFRGEPRNSDLVARVRDEYGEFVLAVEAKVNESFGDTIGVTLAYAVDRKVSNPQSNGVARVQHLVTALFSPRLKNSPPLATLRYQLLTAAAGALARGQRCKVSRVVLLVQEFVTKLTEPEKCAANARDLNRFIARLSGGHVTRVESGHLYGPLRVPGVPLFEEPPELFIGKAVCSVSQ